MSRFKCDLFHELGNTTCSAVFFLLQEAVSLKTKSYLATDRPTILYVRSFHTHVDGDGKKDSNGNTKQDQHCNSNTELGQ